MTENVYIFSHFECTHPVSCGGVVSARSHSCDDTVNITFNEMHHRRRARRWPISQSITHLLSEGWNNYVFLFHILCIACGNYTARWFRRTIRIKSDYIWALHFISASIWCSLKFDTGINAQFCTAIFSVHNAHARSRMCLLVFLCASCHWLSKKNYNLTTTRVVHIPYILRRICCLWFFRNTVPIHSWRWT